MPERHDKPPFHSRRAFAAAAALAAFLVVLALGETTLRAYFAERETELRLDTVSRAAVLRGKVERELNALLYLSSGLGSYLMVRRDKLHDKEVNEILAVLHRSSRHVRNFGVAVGYRLTYLYPLQGNEQAIGLYYPDQPAQWPIIRRLVEARQPALAGPIDLVQGGRGIIYRVPLFVDDKYWGLLSTAIDPDSFFGAIEEDGQGKRYRFALRGKDGQGLRGAPIWGDPGVFDAADAVIQEIDVPGGRWALAVAADAPGRPSSASLIIRGLSGGLGALIAWMLYALIRNRAELARMALYDDLTGLPKRSLFEDRAEMAFARQHRFPDQLCAVLFIDLDGFKAINDTFGHKAGDAVLQATAARARASVRSNDTVARWGGDEFIVLLESVTPEMIESLVSRLRAQLQAPIDFDGRRLAIGVSIGMAIHTESSGDLEEILKIADQRMYDEKQSRSATI